MDNCNNVPKVPYDPGWNDPPQFSYNAQQSTPSRPRNFLNKRVAFPLSGNSSSPVTQPPVNLPPLPTGPPAPAPLQAPPLTADNENMDIDSESVLSEVKSILLQFLDDKSELGPKANDIKKRIDVMEKMWTSGKLNKNIHVLMKQLAEALRDEQPLRADDIHRALMVDHVSAVGTWMPGIKQLIHHSIACNELLSIDNE